MRSGKKSKHGSNDWHEELCALAAIGELSQSEYAELQNHLLDCDECRDLYADFRRICSDDLGRLAIQRHIPDHPGEAEESLSEDELLARFLDRARRENASQNERVTEPSVSTARSGWSFAAKRGLVVWLRQPIPAYGTAVFVVLVALLAGVLQRWDTGASKVISQLNAQRNQWKQQAEENAERETSSSRLLLQSREEQEGLRKLFAETQAKYAVAISRQNRLENELAAERTRIEEMGQDLQVARAATEEKENSLGQLENKLQSATRRTEDLEQIADRLRQRLQAVELASRQSGSPSVVSFGGSDAEKLLGARNLHIVDVYDVDGNGKTRRTYGRVFYVEKKLLAFYAFDLQGKQENRSVVAFQAWGYTQAKASKPENLGLFHMDDASLNRWSLKVDDPHVLEHIDAVFVTLEPQDGSPTPRGRKLLYANLSDPPNHPDGIRR